MKRRRTLPRARTGELITRQLPGELLVYDLRRHKAFCLNQTAAMVWRHCNGQRTVEQLAAELTSEYRSPADEQIVWLALHQLQKSHLLQTGAEYHIAPVTRRRLIRAGIVSAIALPLISGIISPIPAQAATTLTQAQCQAKNPNNPGGCGGNPCTVGGTCQKLGGNCRCR
jgi:hypothetical protein